MHLLNTRYWNWHMAFHLQVSLSYCWLSIMIFPNSPQLLSSPNVCFRMSLCHLKESEMLTNAQNCQSGKWQLKMLKGGNSNKKSMPKGWKPASQRNVGWNVVALGGTKPTSNKEYSNISIKMWWSKSRALQKR